MRAITTLVAFFGFIPVSASLFAQANCSSIVGGCQTNANASNHYSCGTGIRAGTTVTHSKNCTAQCQFRDTNCLTPVGYPASPGSGTVSATGQCGTVDASGHLITGAVECPPVDIGPTTNNAPPGGSTNQYMYGMQNRTQGAEFKSCENKSINQFYSSCGARSCGAGCPTCTPCGSQCIVPGTVCNPGPPQVIELTCCVDSGGTHPCCPAGTPIVIDPANEGFHLTGLSDGVDFATGPGKPLQHITWTNSQYRNGWLVLDRDGNGRIDDMSEMFGNATPQPPSSEPNGFAALSVFDEPRNGGNGNGMIDPGDAVYSSLRLWVDRNHNGISEPEELFTLPAVGLFAMDLRYWPDKKTDEYGNAFNLRSRVWDLRRGPYDHRCYDVILMAEVN